MIKLQMTELLLVMLIGLGATLVMDAWALLMHRLFKLTSLNYCLVGRWIQHLFSGVLRHENIGKAKARPAECLLGWSAHYLLGVIFALALVLLTSGAWLEQPGFIEAVIFGALTVAFPFFILQPSFGLGFAGANTPRPITTRLKSLMAHVSFGIGLYLSAILLLKVTFLAT